ncbi:MAG: T9SS type A sorting domain-containing protein [Crocinitomicaceae bacterium]|nr:T9SS type A sorting domain-containing protein [Crocinitomicaceae bacterium]
MLQRILYSVLVIFLFQITIHGQVEYMINGGFEEWDNDDDDDGNPDDFYDHSIEYAIGWHNLVNTCDVVHPNYPFVSGTPMNGVGCGRFGAPQNGLAEFGYGTTHPLTAGETYQVSFWVRKDYSTNTDRKVGLVISETIPNIQVSPVFTTSYEPLITVIPTSTQYVQVSACYTAQTSGVHYVTIGPFYGTGTPESILYNIDDVSVKSLAPGTQLPIANVSTSQAVYCINDNVIVDGSLTSNETGYIWEIYDLVNGNSGQLQYSSGVQNGLAGTFDVTAALGFYQAGDCYRVVLKAQGACENEAYVDFCFADPNIDFTHDGSAICENTPVTLSVTGDASWTYDWSTGDAGVGLNTLTVTPTVNNSTYSVTVTTPEGCTHTETINLTVHSANNQTPWMNGINGSGNYTIYVSQGNTVSFNSTLFNDDLSENLVIVSTDNIPSSFNDIKPLVAGDNLYFSWQTHMTTPTGSYYYNLNVKDNNACNVGEKDFTFKIIVICDQCPTCLYYENRTPTTTPLPGETKVGQCIMAGITQPVETGTTNVLFQAGESITTGNFFSAGPGYQAVIDPSICITDCEDCCQDWTGFTLDEIPNPVYMNFSDSDPTNDYFQITDVFHPFCAFNAKGFEFSILDQSSSIYHHSEVLNAECCSFKSPAPENLIPHSSIYWDGYTEDIFGNTVRPYGVLFYILKLYGCNDEKLEKHGFIHIGDFAKSMGLSENGLNDEQSENLKALLEENEKLSALISISPNPASEFIKFSGLEGLGKPTIQLFDKNGKILKKNIELHHNTYNISKLPAGLYYLKILTGSQLVTKEFVKL